MDPIEWLRWLFALLCGALALQPRRALSVFWRGPLPEDAQDYVLALRLIGYMGLMVVFASWMVDDFLVS